MRRNSQDDAPRIPVAERGQAFLRSPPTKASLNLGPSKAAAPLFLGAS